MTKYFLKRLLHGALSIIVVVAIVMIMIYSLLNRDLVFSGDAEWTKQSSNEKVVYEYRRWEEYGYLDYVPYADYLIELQKSGEITEEERAAAVTLGKNADADSEATAKYAKQFTEYYESKGYTVERLDAKMATSTKVSKGGKQQLFAHKDVPLYQRLFKYFTHLISIDNIHYAADNSNSTEPDEAVDNPGISFTLFDPVYGGEKFSPAIIGSGTQHKYLLYFDSEFPFVHQNLVSINLGLSYSINKGIDVFETMNITQGSKYYSTVTFPSGLTEESADDLHSATYVAGSISIGNKAITDRYTDNYTNTNTVKSGLSKVGYSFVIGILAVFMSYLLGVPLGIIMARKKDKLLDKLGTLYIVFIIAVPSLAYIFLFKTIGGAIGLPTTFNMDSSNRLMYLLPIVSLALPSIANLMKWLRRYMIDQMNSDYVKFARSGGLSENEIFSKHIFKNAMIPIVHGIPGSVLGALTGAIITERVYVVPGAGNLLTAAIGAYDNGVIVGVTLFYATLSVISIILGDILMSIIDPRISFSSKAR